MAIYLHSKTHTPITDIGLGLFMPPKGTAVVQKLSPVIEEHIQRGELEVINYQTYNALLNAYNHVTRLQETAALINPTTPSITAALTVFGVINDFQDIANPTPDSLYLFSDSPSSACTQYANKIAQYSENGKWHTYPAFESEVVLLHDFPGYYLQFTNGSWVYNYYSGLLIQNQVHLQATFPPTTTARVGDAFIEQGTFNLYKLNSALGWDNLGTLVGSSGTSGNSILNGTINPDNTIGNDGDFYLNTTNYDLWGPKTSGDWAGPGFVQLLITNYVNNATTLTINGVTQDLTLSRSWTVGDIQSSGTYSNPSWLTALGWSKVSSTPTTLAGYGITDSYTKTNSDARYLQLTGGTLTGNIILYGDPTNALHPATKNYVDNLITGVIWVGADVATTGNITLSGEQTIDGYTTSASKVFVRAQSTASQNGIYTSGPGAWVRTSDATTGAQIAKLAIIVENGTTYGHTQWLCTNSSVTVGTTSITFVQISGVGTYTNGTGILLSGTAFSIDTSYTATASRTGYLSPTDWTTFSNKQAALSGTGFVKSASGVISYDTSTYLTTITGIGASGNLGGTFPSPNVIGMLGVNFPTLPTSGNYQLQASITAGSVTAWSFVTPSSSLAISSITAATASNTFDNANYGQTWNWNTLSSGNALLLASTSTAAASNTQTLLNIALSGANSTSTQTTYGMQVTNTHTGTSSTNIAGYFSASGGTINYGLVVNAGRVAIGSSSAIASSSLDVTGLSGAGGLVVCGNNVASVTGSMAYTGKLLIGWNRTGGNGEVDIISNRGSSTGGGQYFWDVDNSGTVTIMCAMFPYGYFGINKSTGVVSNLDVNGSIGFPIAKKTANYTLTSSDHTVIFDGTSLTVTLPAASGCTNRIYVLVNRNATVLTTSTSYLGFATGVSSSSVTAASSIWLQSDGTNWNQIK